MQDAGKRLDAIRAPPYQLGFSFVQIGADEEASCSTRSSSHTDHLLGARSSYLPGRPPQDRVQHPRYGGHDSVTTECRSCESVERPCLTLFYRGKSRPTISSRLCSVGPALPMEFRQADRILYQAESTASSTSRTRKVLPKALPDAVTCIDSFRSPRIDRSRSFPLRQSAT